MSAEAAAAMTDHVSRNDKLGTENYVRIIDVRKEFDGFVAEIGRAHV